MTLKLWLCGCGNARKASSRLYESSGGNQVDVGTGGKPSTWFPPETRRAEQRREKQTLLTADWLWCWLAADAATVGWLAGCWLSSWRAGWRADRCCWLAVVLLLVARSLLAAAGSLPGWPLLAGRCWLPGCCWSTGRLLLPWLLADWLHVASLPSSGSLAF